GGLRFFGIGPDGASIPRLSIENVQLFETPLGSLGPGGAGGDGVKVGGILAGDNLSRFALTLDYRGAAPSMTITATFDPCSCELQPRCDRPDVCNSVFAFSLAGGQDTALQSQTRVVIGSDEYTYPPTRVLVDTCLEPLPDPLTTVVPGKPDYDVCA